MNLVGARTFLWMKKNGKNGGKILGKSLVGFLMWKKRRILLRRGGRCRNFWLNIHLLLRRRIQIGQRADGWGFNLNQFFNKISIKNVKKDDDENYDGKNEIVWQDDDYIRPIKNITTAEWEEAVFKDISPLVVLVHNQYKRPKDNERIRDELEKAVHIIWNCQLPSPRCVSIDAVMELDLVSVLRVSIFPELIFTKAGKILYREKGNRTADELSKIMAFFHFGAAKPSCLSIESNEEAIPSVQMTSERWSNSFCSDVLCNRHLISSYYCFCSIR